MALSERLQFILDLNAAGVIRGFEQVGNAAGRDLRSAEERLDRVGQTMSRVGAGALAFAGVAGVALMSFARSSEEARFSEIQLENTLANMPRLAGENKQAFLDLASAIQGKTAADGDSIVAGQAMLGTFNLTGQEIRNITPLVVDYARKFGVDMTAASVQVGKALDGNIGALARNGVSIDKAAYETDRFTAVQQALANQVGGFAEAEGATFAGSMERMKNQLGDVAEGIGTGVIPVVQQFTGLIGGLTDKFADLSPETQASIGRFAAIGTAAIATVGGVSLLAGQMIRLRNTFSTLDAASGVRSLNRLGVATGAVTAAVVVAATAYTQYAARKAHAEAQTRTFTQALRDEASGVEDAADKAVVATLVNDEWTEALNKAGVSVADAARYVQGEYVPALSDASFENQILISFLEDLKGRFEDATKAAETQTGAERELGVATDATSDSMDSEATYADQLAAALERATTEQREAAQAARDHNNALLEGVNASLAYEGAVDRVEGALAEQAEAAGVVATATRDHGASSTEALAAVEGYDDATRDAAGSALAQAAAAAKAQGAIDGSSESLRIQVAELTAVAVALAPENPLRARLEDYISRLNNVPRTVRTDFEIRRAVAEAQAALPGWLQPDEPIVTQRQTGGDLPPGRVRVHADETIDRTPSGYRVNPASEVTRVENSPSINVTINAQTNASAQDIANEFGWLVRTL